MRRIRCILLAVLVVSCGHGSRSAGPEEPPDPSALFDDPCCFVVFVAEDGGISVGGVHMTEEEMLGKAAERILEDPATRAILLVSSSQIQGIHLTARLADKGYKNVAVYYPTATQP